MVCFRTRLWVALLPLAALIGPGSAQAQAQAQAQAPEPVPEAEAPASPPPKIPPPRKAAPKPKVVPKPKPAPKPAAEARPAAPSAPEPALAPITVPAPMPAANLPGLTVQCGARAALYEGPKDFAVWVTRSGAVVVENPLRPLTPETTRVLEVVIAGKAATAYGPDLFALRRGGSPAALGGLLGAPVRWDPVPATLPDTLNIVSETGQSLAQLGFRECGEAPVVKGAPVAAKDGPAKDGPAKDGPAKDEAAKGGKAAAKPKSRPKVSAGGAAGAKAPPGLSLPQGAIE